MPKPSVEDLKALHGQALQAVEQAKQAVADNEFRLRQSIAEKSKLMTQLESAKMQEQMNSALSTMSDLAPQGDTPSLAEVRDKIEARYATALGQNELASGGVEARMLEVRKATIDSAASSRLDAIRASMAAGGRLGSAVAGEEGRSGRHRGRRLGRAGRLHRSGAGSGAAEFVSAGRSAQAGWQRGHQ